MNTAESTLQNSAAINDDEKSDSRESRRTAAVIGLISVAFVLPLTALIIYFPNVVQVNEFGVADFPGLSPALKACYAVQSQIHSIIIAISYGIAIGVSYIFGTFLYMKFQDSTRSERLTFWDRVSTRLLTNNNDDISQAINGFQTYQSNLLDKRNTYWALYLRATLAIAVVMTIALLIVACKVEAQAGLPIITGIISFIIGQSTGALQSPGPTIVVSHQVK
jgi:hypothetical protein